MKRRRLVLLIAALPLAGPAVLPGPSWAQLQAPGLAARVNGQPITAERLERGFEEYLRDKRINIGAMRSPQRAKTLKREVLDLLIEQELLWQEAQREGLVASANETGDALAEIRGHFADGASFAARLATEGYTESSYAQHLRRLLSARKLLDGRERQVTVGDQQVADFYRRHADRFVQPEMRRLSHIAVHVATEAQRSAAHDLMKALREAVQGGAEFATLARQHSQGPQAAQGGDLGELGRGDMAEPLSRAAFALAPGELSAPVETPDGVHLLRLESVRPAHRLPESAVRERLAAQLRAQQVERDRADFVKRLLADARIEVLVPLPAAQAQLAEEPRTAPQRARRVDTRRQTAAELLQQP